MREFEENLTGFGASVALADTVMFIDVVDGEVIEQNVIRMFVGDPVRGIVFLSQPLGCKQFRGARVT